MARDFDGLLIDAGGVLTTDLFASFDAALEREGITGTPFLELYRSSPQIHPLLLRLEVGELHHTDVEGPLAAMLGLPEDRADGLFERLYADVAYVAAMMDAVAGLRAAGVRTGLLSNSWWYPIYEDPAYERAFDELVISGRVGVRKPEPRMFDLGVEALGVAPERIVFVDDFEENLVPAEAMGMRCVLHDPYAPEASVAALEELFGVRLAA